MTTKALNDLRAEKSAVVGKMTALHEQIGDALPTDEQQKAYDGFRADLKKLDGQISRAAEIEEHKTHSAQPIQPFTPSAPNINRGAEPVTKGHTFAGVIRAFAAADGNMDAAVKMAKDAGADHIVRGLNASDPFAGGLLVAPVVADDFIDLLRPREVVTPMVEDIRPLDAGAISIPRGTSDAIAAFKGEAKPTAVSTPGTGNVSLVARELSAMVPISNTLLRFTARNGSAARADQMALNSLLKATGLRKDLAFVRGDGSNNTPRGLRSFAEEAGNLIAASGGSSIVDIEANANLLLTRLANANVQMLKPGWIMAPRTRIFLGSLRDGNGNRVYPEAYQPQADGSFYWRGYPIRETTQVPINLGGSSNASELGLVDFSEVVIGDVEGIRVSMSSEATYFDGVQWQSAFANGETLTKVDMGVDQQMKHIEAAAWLTGVTWGG